MCTYELILLSAAAAIAVASVASTTATAVNQQKAGQAQNKVSKLNAQLQNAQIARNQAQESEASAARAFDLARQHQLAKGTAKASNLGDRSVRAVGRSLGFQLGQDKATLKRNQEIAATQAGARLRGIELTRTSEQIQIGDISGATTGLQIGVGVIGGIARGVSAFGALGGTTPTVDGVGTTTTTLDASGGPAAFDPSNIA